MCDIWIKHEYKYVQFFEILKRKNNLLGVIWNKSEILNFLKIYFGKYAVPVT